MLGNAGSSCKALTKDGQACKAPPTAGGLCYFHANPDQASLLGKIGGRKNRRQTGDTSLSPPLDAAEVREILAQAIVNVQTKTLAPREAVAIANLANTLLRSIQVSDLEERLAKVEKQMEEGDRAVIAVRAKTAEPDEDVRWWYTEGEGVEAESGAGSPSK